MNQEQLALTVVCPLCRAGVDELCLRVGATFTPYRLKYAHQVRRDEARKKHPVKARLKLFVWDPALKDYYPGAIFVIAPNLREARRLAREDFAPGSQAWTDTEKKPEVFDLDKASPQAWLVWGDG